MEEEERQQLQSPESARLAAEVVRGGVMGKVKGVDTGCPWWNKNTRGERAMIQDESAVHLRAGRLFLCWGGE